jgi:hypothetical protein
METMRVTITNPTGQPGWFTTHNGETLPVAPGETLTLQAPLQPRTVPISAYITGDDQEVKAL